MASDKFSNADIISFFKFLIWFAREGLLRPVIFILWSSLLSSFDFTWAKSLKT
jgi:hypothetical protein